MSLLTATVSGIFNVDVKKDKRSVVMILASSMDSIIGKDNTIPWSCKTDMKFFKRATTGNVVIMGRKTFESMNSKPLPNRVNIVVSKTLKRNVVGADTIIVSSMFEALKHARAADLSDYNRNTLHEHIFIIGGIQIYSDTAKICDELLHSTIDAMSGREGDGRACIMDHILPKFSSSDMNAEILYFNNKTIETGDINPLREIRHVSKLKAYNTFEFKSTTGE